MQTYTVTQKIISIGATYQIRSGESKDVLMTVKGKILTFTPKLEMKKGTEGEIINRLKGNFTKTKFSMEDMNANEIANIQFPYIAFKKRFSLTIGDKTYNAQGSFTAWHFNCTDDTGKEVFSISKDFSFRDKFTVNIDESMPKEIILLTAIAVDQKFFQQK